MSEKQEIKNDTKMHDEILDNKKADLLNKRVVVKRLYDAGVFTKEHLAFMYGEDVKDLFPDK